MNDVQFNAAALARHKASLERYVVQHAAQARAAAPAPPSFAAAMTAPPPSAARVAEPRDDAVPTLTSDQFALLANSFAPVAEPEKPKDAKTAEIALQIPEAQKAMLAASLGMTADSAKIASNAASGIPIAKDDPNMSSDQMALLMASFGVSGHGAATPDGPEPTAAQTAKQAPTPAKKAAAAAAPHFFSTAPRERLDTAAASDAYLSAMKTNLGRYGR